ncbi:putative glutathione S-transferase [Amniculicola lignicola CBS 123094]|uniref:Putative glutathione S-transferase n=1 Tax=Amniculicola lignicola CBS 123094 TaxID=1392246 RepID=A0A6A5WWG0_9PLEO|nr:putative glutathione S-transferase [Amniculicola lignicola CBS 123094]
MPLTIHHLGISQSERVLFLCEELSIPYKLVKHIREPILSPQSLQSVPGNETGKAPFIVDDDVTLSESGAIVEYILSKYESTNGIKLKADYGEKGYVDYIYWFHYANAGLQPAMVGSMFLSMVKGAENANVQAWATQRLEDALQHIDNRLKGHKWLAGEQFTAADIMMVYSLTTQRYFGPLVGYEKYPHIVKYLEEIGKRPAYKKAKEKGDPKMRLLLGAEPPAQTIVESGGVHSTVWKM